MSKMGETLAALKGRESLGEMWKLAGGGAAPAPRVAVNAHIHLPPNFSAFGTVGQAVGLAIGQGVGVVGVSNYYDYTVYGEFGELCRKSAVYPLFGLEIICMHEDLRLAGVKINDPGNPGKMYICGKGITKLDNMSPVAARVLGKFRATDVARIEKMVAATEGVFAARGLPTGMTTAKVVDMVVKRHGCERGTVYLQERHVAQAFQEAAFALVPAGERLGRINAVLGMKTSAKNADDAVAVQNDLRSHLLKMGKPAYVEEKFVSFEEALELITGMGGVPVYPVLADGSGAFQPFETPVEKFIAGLQTRNIHAAEFIPNRNAAAVLTTYTKAMRAAGMVVTAGTEHNTLDLIGMEPVCKDGPIPEELKAIYWEGACVMAAHQFLTLHGETGFVDEARRPNGKYAGGEERISAFAKLGAAVIRAFREN